MSTTHTLQVNVSSSDGTRIAGSSQEVGATAIPIDVSLSAGTVNQLQAMAWTVANTQAIYLLSSQNLTIKTNSSSSPANTINLIANVPYIFRASAGYNTSLFTVDVTAWYLSCSASARLLGAILTN